jgi:hypothetical protein
MGTLKGFMAPGIRIGSNIHANSTDHKYPVEHQIPESSCVSFGLGTLTTFRKLSEGWNAEPNAPDPRVKVEGRDVVVSFLMNPFGFLSPAPRMSADCAFSPARDTVWEPPTMRVGIVASADSARSRHSGGGLRGGG